MMVKQNDLVSTKSSEESGSHGSTDEEFEEYSEEEMLSEEPSEMNENYLSDEESIDEDSVSDKPDEEGSDEEPEEACEECPTDGEAIEEASEDDLTDVSIEEIIEEEVSEESDEDSYGEEPVDDSHGEKKASKHILSESKTAPDSYGNQCPRESSELSSYPIVSNKPDISLTSCKKRRSRWDIMAGDPVLDVKAEDSIKTNDITDLAKRRKTRWSSEEAQLSMSSALKLPDSLKDILSSTCSDRRIQKLNVKLQKINQKLEGISENAKALEKMSSFLPIYNGLHYADGALENKQCTKLLKEKNRIISKLLILSRKNDEPERSSKAGLVFCKKLYLPVKEYPNYNFIGLILGPKGNSLKKMEKETGASLRIRGRGSCLRDKNLQDSHEELHVLIESDSQESCDAAVRMVEKLIVPMEDRMNYYKAAQLRELAEIRGNLNQFGWKVKPCDICGGSSHPTSDCPLTATTSQADANIFAVAGSLFSSSKSSLPLVPQPHADKPKEGNNLTKLYVGHLPLSVSRDKLKELFLNFGSISDVVLIKDKNTGQNNGSGFVWYNTPSDAAKAIAAMNGRILDGKKLAVRIAGSPPPLNINLPIYPNLSTSVPPPSLNLNLPNYLKPASIQSPSLNLTPTNYLGLSHVQPPPSNANLLYYPGLASISPPSLAIPPVYPRSASIPPPNAYPPIYPNIAPNSREILNPNCWPGPPGSLLPESNTLSPKSSVAYTKNGASSLPSSSFGSGFQTSVGKKLDVASTPLMSSQPSYPRYAAIRQETSKPDCWPGPPGSMLPEAGTLFFKNGYNSSRHAKNFSLGSSAYLSTKLQTSISSSSQIPGIASEPSELASFPGYLKSIDDHPLVKFNQSMIPSRSLSSQAPYFIGQFFGNQMNSTRR